MKSIRFLAVYAYVIAAEALAATAHKAHALLFDFMVGQGLIKCVTSAPFPIQPDLTAIAVSYRNNAMIADEVLPRIQVAKQDFKYFAYNLAEGFTIPDVKVGRRSPPTQVEFTGTEQTASTLDYAIDDSIPNVDIENASDQFNPVERGTMFITNLLELAREVRVANLIFGATNYSAANKVQLSGTSQWSDYTNSNPVSAILTALDTMIMRPNAMVIGQSVWTVLRQHPKLLSALNGAGGSTGIATRQQLAGLLEIDDVYVGTSFVNTAKKGQTATMSRVWGKHVAFMYREPLADNSRGTTFGFTAQFGARIAGSFEDKDIGMRGGTRLRVGESVRELVTAGDLGYFFQDAVA